MNKIKMLLKNFSPSTRISLISMITPKINNINFTLSSNRTTKTFNFKNLKSFSFAKKNEECKIMYSSTSTESTDIGLITIKNSPKRNAFSLQMTTDLINLLTKINQDFNTVNSPKVIILATEGECFSAGHDLCELIISSPAQRAVIFTKFAELAILIPRIKPIIISEVQGLATAAGCQLACSCDLIVASSNSEFEMPGVKIGLFPQTPAVSLARLIGTKRAMQMLLTSEPIGSAKALEWGIADEIVDVQGMDFASGRERLREASLCLARRISEFSTEKLGLRKRGLNARAR